MGTHGGLSLLSPTHMLFAQQSLLSTVISWLTSTLVPLNLSLDERPWSLLSSATKTSHRCVAREFLSWIADSNIPEPSTRHQLDAFRWQYLPSEVEIHQVSCPSSSRGEELSAREAAAPVRLRLPL